MDLPPSGQIGVAEGHAHPYRLLCKNYCTMQNTALGKTHGEGLQMAARRPHGLGGGQGPGPGDGSGGLYRQSIASSCRCVSTPTLRLFRSKTAPGTCHSNSEITCSTAACVRCFCGMATAKYTGLVTNS